jgi:serine/threonine protein kinase
MSIPSLKVFFTNALLHLHTVAPKLPYGGHVDLWSCGCILAEMMKKKPLFPGKSHTEQVRGTLLHFLHLLYSALFCSILLYSASF